jgi:HEAT repeat protein
MEDINIDVSVYSSIQIFVKRLKRINIESVTFSTSCDDIDVDGFLDLVAKPPKDISTYNDLNTLLIEKKADKVYLNTVEFKIKTKGEEELLGGGTIGEGGAGGVGIEEETEFDLVNFLEKTCNVKDEDSPSVEADKVTEGLVELYDNMISERGDGEIPPHEAVFEKVMGSISSEAKRFIIQDKLKLKQISSIIKSIIMTFSDEEIVEIFINRVRLLGVFDAEEILTNLTPERLDGILPEIREKLKLMNIEEKYIAGLEKRIRARKGTARKELPEEKEGGKQGGEISNISAFVSNFSQISEENYGIDEISNFFSSVCLIKKDDENKADKISDGIENFVKEFIKQFGHDKLLQQSLKIKKTLEKVPDNIRKEIFIRIIKSKSPLKVTIAKILLPLMDNESIVSTIVTLIEEGQKELLDGFLSSLDKEKLSSVRKLAEEHLKKLGIGDEEFPKLWDKLTASEKNIRRSEGVSKKAYGRLQDKLKTSIGLTDVNSLMEALYKSLDSDSTEVRLNSLLNIQSLIEQLFKGEKGAVIRRITDNLIEYARKEKNKDVYTKYVEVISQIGLRSIVIGYDFLISAIISFFAGEVSNTAKAKIIIPHLSEFKTKEAINVLLSLLWEKDLREMVVEKVDEFGVESIPYLMELLKDSEDKDVRFALLKIIQSIGKGALDIVKRYLRDKRWYVRRNAILIMGSISGEEILDDIYALKDDHEKIQIEIIRTLKHILKTEAETYLLAFLDSKYLEVQKYALSTLQSVISEEGVTALNKRLLLNSFSKEPESQIKQDICDILAEKGNSESIEALTQIINSKKVFGIAEFPDDLRYKAVKAVAEIGGVRAEGLIKSLSRDRSKKIRAFVAERLSKR